MVFTLVHGKGSRFQWFDYPQRCTINLQWNDTNRVHTDDTFVLVANDTRLPGNSNDNLQFIPVPIPPFVSLAHELGHYFDELIAYKKHIEITIPEVVAEAIVKINAVNASESHGPLAVIQSTSTNIVARSTEIEMQDCWRKISQRIVQPAPNINARKAFAKSWGAKHEEPLNILPSSRILQNGGSNYSDGYIIGEAVLANLINLQLPPGGGTIDVTGLGKESFLRFSHEGYSGLIQILGTLQPGDKTEYKNLTAQMLRLMTDAGGNELSVANNNLPRIV
jgi:hypothetical protein